MCAKHSLYQPADESSVIGESYGSMYRVLRRWQRCQLRSVDRDHAGRNAISVKGLSPDKHYLSWWPSQYTEAKAASVSYRPADTTGVRDHGMYGRLIQELGRARRGRSNSINIWQGVMTKSNVMPHRAVRRSNCSEEVG